jgi:MFS family permease
MHFFAAVLVPFYTEWGGISLTEVLVLNAWFMFWSFVLEVPTGTVADFLGRKVSLALGSAVGLVGAVVYASAPSLGVFLAAELVMAVAYTLHSGADEALAYDSLAQIGETERAKRTLARLEASKLAGIVVATIAGGFIAARLGLRAPMLAYIVPAGAACLLALLLAEPPARASGASRPTYGRILVEGGRYFLAHRVLLLLTAELAVTNALAWGIIWLFQPLLARSGVPLAGFGLVHAAACLGQIAFLSRVEWAEARLGSRRHLLRLATAAAGVAFITLALTRWAPLVIVAIVAGFTFSLPRIPIFGAYMNRHIPSDKRATVLSVTSMCRTLAIVVVNPVIGLLADWSLSGTMALLGGGLVVLACLSRIEERHLTA